MLFRSVLEFYYGHRNNSARELVKAVLSSEKMWGLDLTQIAGLEALVTENLETIRTAGSYEAMKSLL